MENIALNNISAGNIHPQKLAVGESNRTATLNIGQPWAGGHQKVIEQNEVRNDLNFEFKEKETVEVVSLDEFLSSNNMAAPDYLKVDIDGSEMPFMRGAKNTLANKQLKGIIFELEITDKNFGSIIGELNKNGFIEKSRFGIPSEPHLFNIIFERN